MIVSERNLEFNFTDALDVIKFDDASHELSFCMKAVDFVVELSEAYLFVEIKDPTDPSCPLSDVAGFTGTVTNGDLRKQLVVKFRDSFVYRWAEEKLEKPVHFLSLITLEEPLLKPFQDDLHRHLPFKGPIRWSQQIVKSCNAINLEAWNRNFTKWPVRRLTSPAAAPNVSGP